MECTRHSSCRPWIRTNRTEKRRLTLNGDNGKSLERTVSRSKLNSVGSPGSSRDASSILVSRPFDIEMTKKLRAATTRSRSRLDLSRRGENIYSKILIIYSCAYKNARSPSSMNLIRARSKLARISLEIPSQVLGIKATQNV